MLRPNSSALQAALLLSLALVACAAPPDPQAGTDARPAVSPTPAPTATPSLTPSLTPSPTPVPSVTPTRPPTITPQPAERNDNPSHVPPVALPPGGFLSWAGTVEALVNEQDWLAIYLPAGADGSATLSLEMQCGGGDTARVAVFSAGVADGVDADGNGRLNYEEGLATGAAADFEISCLQESSATLPGGADYYLVVYAAFGGRTGYQLYASR